MSITAQFVRFAQVGVAGFVIDSACLTLFLWLGAGFLVGRGLSYLYAATTTWALNRLWTFASGNRTLFAEWAKFLSANAVGGAINCGASVILAIVAPHFIGQYPVFAVAVGSLSGLFVNFGLSKRFVFGASSRSRPFKKGKPEPLASVSSL